MSTVVAREFMHSCYVRLEGGGDAVVIKERLYHNDNTVVPNLRVITNPKRSFYITKPEYRTYQFKKEWEDIDKLDEYVVPNSELANEIYRALNGYRPRHYVDLKKVCNSPYVFGATVGVETLIKHKYDMDFEKTGIKAIPHTFGVLDIETSVVPGTEEKIIIITVTHMNRIYTGIVDSVFYNVITDENGKKNHVRATIEQLKTLSQKTLAEENEKYGLEYFYYIARNEQDLVEWIFLQIMNNKTDYIGVWNLAFDATRIMQAIQRSDNPDLKHYFCSRELPGQYKYLKYIPDNKRDLAHMALKWNWLACTSETQFLDFMSMYALIRIVKGAEPSYKLNDILLANGIGGKKYFEGEVPDDLSPLEWHIYMQTYEILKYTVYNQYDCISIYLMELKNDDIGVARSQCGYSSLRSFNKKTVLVITDDLHFYTKQDGKRITAAVGEADVMRNEYEKVIQSTGGAVLSPSKMYRCGTYLVKERPDSETLVHVYVNDVDFTGMYPNSQASCNICKETKLMSVYNLDGRGIAYAREYTTMLVSRQANAVRMCHRYFNLPSYLEMEQMFLQQGHRS